MNTRSVSSTIIIGAGLSGLTAAQHLAAFDIKAKIIEQHSIVGGRLAGGTMSAFRSHRPSQAAFDYGAQFFTVRDPRFKELVDKWTADGLVVEWSQGFAAPDGSYLVDGYPRFRGHPNMASIAKYLAQDLDILLNKKVTSIELKDGLWSITLEDKRQLLCSTLVLTPPVPISLSLLGSSWGNRAAAERMLLEKMIYDPCLALLVLIDGHGSVPHPGGLWPSIEEVDWIADNYQKGLSPVPGALTIHASADFSREYWQAGDDLVCTKLLEAADPWIKGRAIKSQVYRWRYSKPAWTYRKPYLVVDIGAPVIFAGDAFAGPRVEGAVLSGLEAAGWLLGRYSQPAIL